MENFDRYKNFDYQKMNKKGLSHFFLRSRGDKVIFPVISQIKNRKIIEIGVGAGYYSICFIKNHCNITGVDINPYLGRDLPFDIIKSKADIFSLSIRERDYDFVLSFWLTEYLNFLQLNSFFKESHSVLKSGGIFITTLIANKGWGFIYTSLAKLKGIKKYGYSKNEIIDICRINKFSIKELTIIRGRFNLTLGYLLIAVRK